MGTVKPFFIVLPLMAIMLTPPAKADRNVVCESRNDRYTTCDIPEAGYVTLVRQLSRDSCRQGRTWDFDKRHIWVDDGCRAEFRVESRDNHGGKTTAVAAAAAIGIIAAAAIAARNNNKGDDRDDYDHYGDEDYGHGGHSSYVPGWMTGRFRGYNTRRGVEVMLEVARDGRVVADVSGTTLRGYVNDGRLYLGSAEFYIDRAGSGFATSEVGNRRNQVHYTRD